MSFSFIDSSLGNNYNAGFGELETGNEPRIDLQAPSPFIPVAEIEAVVLPILTQERQPSAFNIIDKISINNKYIKDLNTPSSQFFQKHFPQTYDRDQDYRSKNLYGPIEEVNIALNELIEHNNFDLLYILLSQKLSQYKSFEMLDDYMKEINYWEKVISLTDRKFITLIRQNAQFFMVISRSTEVKRIPREMWLELYPVEWIEKSCSNKNLMLRNNVFEIIFGDGSLVVGDSNQKLRRAYNTLKITQVRNDREYYSDLVEKIWMHHPKSFIHLSKMEKIRLYGNEFKRDNQITIAHYLFSVQDQPHLIQLINRYPDALDWPDADGHSVKDLAGKDPNLSSFLQEILSEVANNSRPQDRCSTPSIVLSRPQPPKSLPRTQQAIESEIIGRIVTLINQMYQNNGTDLFLCKLREFIDLLLQKRFLMKSSKRFLGDVCNIFKRHNLLGLFFENNSESLRVEFKKFDFEMLLFLSNEAFKDQMINNQMPILFFLSIESLTSVDLCFQWAVWENDYKNHVLKAEVLFFLGDWFIREYEPLLGNFPRLSTALSENGVDLHQSLRSFVKRLSFVLSKFPKEFNWWTHKTDVYNQRLGDFRDNLLRLIRIYLQLTLNLIITYHPSEEKFIKELLEDLVSNYTKFKSCRTDEFSNLIYKELQENLPPNLWAGFQHALNPPKNNLPEVPPTVNDPDVQAAPKPIQNNLPEVVQPVNIPTVAPGPNPAQLLGWLKNALGLILGQLNRPTHEIIDNLIDDDGNISLNSYLMPITEDFAQKDLLLGALIPLLRCFNHLPEEMFSVILPDHYGVTIDQWPSVSLPGDSLSDRQINEIRGSLYQLKKIEVERARMIPDWDTLKHETAESLSTTRLNVIPLLVIRSHKNMFHAEIVSACFTANHQLICVKKDHQNQMRNKILEVAGVDNISFPKSDEDLIALISVEGMENLTNFCTNHPGLNLLILPRLELFAVSMPEAPVVPLRRPERVRIDSAEATSKRKKTDSNQPHKKQQIAPTPEPTPSLKCFENENDQKGVAFYGILEVGKRDHDLDEDSPSKRLKVTSQQDESDTLLPSITTQQVHADQVVQADTSDPAAYLKNFAFNLIHETIAAVKKSDEIKKILSKNKINLPLESKLTSLADAQEPFLFTKLYDYQAADLKRILHFAANGIYPAISYPMGLGKTFLYVELLIQQIAQNSKAIQLVVVPKSLLTQSVAAVRKGILTAKATAWKVLWNQKRELASELLGEIIKKADPSTLMTVLPAIQSIDLLQLRFLIKKIDQLMTPEFVENEELCNLIEELNDELTSLNTIDRAKVKELSASIAQLSSDMFVTPEHQRPLSENEIRSLERIVLYPLSNIVSLENINKKTKTPFIPGGIVLTKYHQVQKLPQLQGHDQLDSITFDEAQKIHKRSDPKKNNANREGLTDTVSGFISLQKKDEVKKFMVTATLFENDLSELWTLLQMANPAFFPSPALAAHLRYYKEVEKQLHGIVKDSNPELDIIIHAFAESYRLKKLLNKFVIYLSKKDPNLRSRIKLPTIEKRSLEIVFTEQMRSRVDGITFEYVTKSNSFLPFLSKISSAITHESFNNTAFNTTVPPYRMLVGRIEAGETETVINESPLFASLFKSEAFKIVFDQKKKCIIALDHEVPGELLSLLIEKKHGPYSKFYNGSLNEKQRNDMVLWFKEGPSTEPRVLILSILAGGVGLNLPEADIIIPCSKNMNRSVIKQFNA